MFSHSTIRAGRNSPDKGLRYLRTVIVTAAVYWSLSNRLDLRLYPLLLTYQHWAGVSPYTLLFSFAGTCVLDKQFLNNLLLWPGTAWYLAGHLQKVTPSFIAEFLDHLSPVRLSLLDQPTCVGCRYGKIYIFP